MSPSPNFASSFVRIVAGAALLALAACDDGAPPPGAAAWVNGRQIVLQAGATVSDNAALRPALERLIDQELLADQARQLRLDRLPAVQAEIEAARQRILARAYVDRHMTSRAPSEAEIVRFYDEHPALFAQRRVYRFEELILALSGDALRDLEGRLPQLGGFDDVARWLNERRIPFRRNATIRAAEQLPAAALPRLAAMSPGQLSLFRGSEGVSLVHLLQVEASPQTLAEARPAVERLLLEQKRTAFAEARAGQLRDKANIEYAGNFKPPAADGRNALRPAGNGKRDEEHVARGLSGLL